ncbi:MAG: hypothetical protein HY466_05425 [Deltaproteobacteria bacterium]|nr:hypothetical protein [Deltaproteobacteria bacterium]
MDSLFRLEEGGVALNILVYFDKEDETWIAHCLELDLVEDGDDKLDATLHLLEMMAAQVQECKKDHINFIHPAPAEYWYKLHQAKPFSLIKELEKKLRRPLERNVVIKELSDVAA